ncbi:hypothetical protein PR048_029941 [Dryococelus australis]|uniref:Uncharacterized protein n=1 Tax=Dryococelus australis TaxID=614101 RepID=A0ABQ9G7L3_9NEOP|nr:hypothetical protein PR048_029941 [Dryococelus australis]
MGQLATRATGYPHSQYASAHQGSCEFWRTSHVILIHVESDNKREENNECRGMVGSSVQDIGGQKMEKCAKSTNYCYALWQEDTSSNGSAITLMGQGCDEALGMTCHCYWEVTESACAEKPTLAHWRLPLRVALVSIPDFLHVGILPDNAAGQLVSSRISGFPCPYISLLLYVHFASLSLALKIWMSRVTHTSPLHVIDGPTYCIECLWHVGAHGPWPAAKSRQVVSCGQRLGATQEQPLEFTSSFIVPSQACWSSIPFLLGPVACSLSSLSPWSDSGCCRKITPIQSQGIRAQEYRSCSCFHSGALTTPWAHVTLIFDHDPGKDSGGSVSDVDAEAKETGNTSNGVVGTSAEEVNSDATIEMLLEEAVDTAGTTSAEVDSTAVATVISGVPEYIADAE